MCHRFSDCTRGNVLFRGDRVRELQLASHTVVVLNQNLWSRKAAPATGCYFNSVIPKPGASETWTLPSTIL